MKRSEAIQLLNEHLHQKNLINHSLAVEACMKSLAGRFGGNPDRWALAGLLHDLDYQYTHENPEDHGRVTAELLKDKLDDPAVIHAIQAHNQLVPIGNPMDRALYAVDPATGFIVACALIHPSRKLSSITLKRMKKRFREKSFARGANRSQIQSCEEMQIPLDEFLTTCLEAMQSISDDLEL